MHKLRISRLAEADLEDIQARGLANFGLASTRAFMARFDDIFARLRTYPLIGRSRPEFGRGIRSCPNSPSLVIYRYEADLVSIERVLHMAQRTQPIGYDT